MKSFVSIAGVPAEIRSEQLPCTSLDRHRYAKLLGKIFPIGYLKLAHESVQRGP
jgi:hypothetical protein